MGKGDGEDQVTPCESHMTCIMYLFGKSQEGDNHLQDLPAVSYGSPSPLHLTQPVDGCGKGLSLGLQSQQLLDNCVQLRTCWLQVGEFLMSHVSSCDLIGQVT